MLIMAMKNTSVNNNFVFMINRPKYVPFKAVYG